MRRSRSIAKGGLRAAFFCLGLCLAPLVPAHGDHDPKHGGVIGRGSDDVIAELAVERGVVVLYLEQEDETPIPALKVKGTLTLMPQQRPRQQATLVPAGANKLAAKGLQPVPGDRLAARLTLPNGDEANLLFLYSK